MRMAEGVGLDRRRVNYVAYDGGAYAVSGRPVDLLVLLAIGGVGFLMRRYGLPVLPVIIGVILGPDAELQLRRALQIADGDVSTLFSTPLSITVYVVIVALFVVPLILRRTRRSTPDDRTPANV